MALTTRAVAVAVVVTAAAAAAMVAAAQRQQQEQSYLPRYLPTHDAGLLSRCLGGLGVPAFCSKLAGIPRLARPADDMLPHDDD